MATRTIANGGGNWNSTGTWVEGAIPTASDDVVATATSGQLTISAASACRSIDLTSYTNTLTHNAFVLTIGTSTAGPGNVALKFPTTGWIYTLANSTSSSIAFSSSVNSTIQTIDFGGKTTAGVSFSASGTSSGYQLVNNSSSTGASATVTLTQGSFDTNNQTCSWGFFVSNNSNSRTLTLGTSSITLAGASASNPIWNTTTTTNMTFNANTSTITFTGTPNGSSSSTMAASDLTYNSVVFTLPASTSTATLTGTNPTFANFTITTGAANQSTFSFATNITVSTSLTITGNNANLNRLMIKSNITGTARTITNNGSGTFSNLDLQDITGAGTASWDLSAISGGAGDCQGNSNIIFTTARTLFWVGNTSSWSTANKWSLSSGGSANQSNPLAQDSIIFDANSFSGSGQTVTANMGRLGKDIDFSNVTNNPTINLSAGTSLPGRLYGSLTLKSGMTSSGTSIFRFEGRSSNSFTTAGVALASGMNVDAPGGTLTLSGDLTTTLSSGVSLVGGTLTATTSNVTAPQIVSQPSTNTTRVLNMGSGTWTANGTGVNPWGMTAPTNMTLNANTSTVVVSDTSAAAKIFAGGGKTYNIVTFSGDNITINGANTFGTLNVNTGGLTNGLIFPIGNNQTITGSMSSNGSAGNLAKIVSNTPGSPATLIKSSGTISVDYMSIKDSAATGGATWYAGANSTNVSGNSGWIFTAAPSAGGTRLALLGVG